VIGGTGHIGGYLVPRLLENSWEVVVVSRGNRRPADGERWRGVELVQLDRSRDEASGRWREVLSRVDADAVVDLICFTQESARIVYEVFSRRVEHFVHCGTAWTIGRAGVIPTPESYPPRPIISYGVEKLAIADFYVERWQEEGFPATVLNPTNIAGAGKAPLNPYGTRDIRVLESIARGDTILLPERGETLVMPCHASDVAQAFLLALEKRGASIGQVFNVGTRYAITYNEMVRIYADVFGVKPRVKHVSMDEFEQNFGRDEGVRYHHTVHMCVDITKVSELLGYRPVYSPEEALRDAVSWLRHTGQLGF